MAKKKNKTRNDGRIAVQVYLGLDENGKRKYKTVYGKTQAEADNKAREIKNALGKGMDVTASNEKFIVLADKWLKQKHGKVSSSWYASYKAYVRIINRYISDKMIKDIKTSDIDKIISEQAMLNTNTGQPSSKKHLVNLLSTIKQIFDYAISDRITDFNPALKVELPKTQEPQKRRALTDEEQKWILATEHRAKRAAMIMMYSGLRKGELIALVWSDIDLESKTINVNKSAESINGRYEVKYSAKTKDSIRIVDIPQRLVDYLRNEQRDSLLVCVNAQGKMHTDTSWKRMWESYLAEINFLHGDFGLFQNKPKSKYDPKGVPFVIPHFTAHWLRHTFCTLMYLAGCDLLTAKNQMGHSDARTTLSIYSHLDAVYKRKSMLKLDDFLESASQMQVS